MLTLSNNTVKRIVFASALVAAAALLIFAHFEIHRGISYCGQNPSVDALPDTTTPADGPLSTLDEPEGLNYVVHLTVGGSCTPAAALGSDSFGTFNRMAEDEGREVFLAGLNRILAEDDCTVLGCAAVLSDREHSFEEMSVENLPNLGPASNAEVFSLSSVEILSLAHTRAEIFGAEGLADTKNAIETYGLQWTDRETPVFFDIYGIRIGVLGIKISQEDDAVLLCEKVSAAAEACDYLILYAEPQQSMETEEPTDAYEEPADTYYDVLSRQLIDAGCDLICCAGDTREEGPTAEEYNGGTIVTSLGYLLDGSAFAAGETALYCLSLSVKDGVIEGTKGELIPISYPESPWFPAVE